MKLHDAIQAAQEISQRRADHLPEAERCPHCGGLVRVRGINSQAEAVVKTYLREQEVHS